MDTSTLQMALIAYQAERHKIEEKIAEIRAQLNGHSRQASSSFSKADHGMPHANLDPDIAALPISRQAKYQKQWKRDGRCTQCGKQRPPGLRDVLSWMPYKEQGQGHGVPRDQRSEAQFWEYQLSGVGSRHMNVSSISGGNARSDTGKHLRLGFAAGQAGAGQCQGPLRGESRRIQPDQFPDRSRLETPIGPIAPVNWRPALTLLRRCAGNAAFLCVAHLFALCA